MRVQHNIAAMNSYRNYNNNTKSINKNLEKLSSGYKINRAGDDAAGLAISEKMRAQITGLEVAQKNAKDGISLVQTAEGALTEVHSMLNRMVELAEQSANGTYEGLDREQLQKEVGKLRDEINRIADSSNFNGIKLLDGSMAGAPSGSANGMAVDNVTAKKGAIQPGTKVQQVNTATFQNSFNSGDLKIGDTMTVSVEMNDGTIYRESVKMVTDSNSDTKCKFEYADGTQVGSLNPTFDGLQAADTAALAKQVISDKMVGLLEDYTVANSGAALTLTANTSSFEAAGIKNISVSGGKNTLSADTVITTEGKGSYKTLDFTKVDVYDSGSQTKNVANSVFTVNGLQFAFVKDNASAAELGGNVNCIIPATPASGVANGDANEMIGLINRKTGLNLSELASGTTVDLITYKGGSASGGLSLQIGDTSDPFNRLDVSIADMHASTMGIGGIDISTQAGAATAVDTIKSAINYVSDCRGTLGATQNRLEHTINNLSVMQENIQDAESTIRDTDVAAEMMKYTKNSILVQSAQAMLAQANQQPQGVLQLLQ